MSKPPRVVTFYSYKGGVGRTLALLNVAVQLARKGQKVVAVDMDLEAPGFHRFTALGLDDEDAPGISDYVFERLGGHEQEVTPYVQPVREVRGVEDRLFIVTAGSRARELAEHVGELYDPVQDQALIFRLFVAHLHAELQPDFVLFDSRTGLAEIAAVCTVDLAEVIVALTGINPQGVDGLADVVGRIRRHPGREKPPLFFLVYSPVPRAKDFKLKDMWRRLDPTDPLSFAPEVLDHALAQRLSEAHARLWVEAVLGDPDEQRELLQRFPDVPDDARVHLLEYDPMTPLRGEHSFEFHAELENLGKAYERLANALGRTRDSSSFPALRPGAGRDSWLERIASIHNAIERR